MFSALLYSTIIHTGLFVLIIILSLGVSSAQVRSSDSYQLQSDSINVGGGLSGSDSYRQENTIGEIATGLSQSINYSLRAGYQQMQEVYISLSSTGDVIMSPDLFGLTGDNSNGSTTFTVITDSSAGYQLTIEAENDPAMQNGAFSITDYDEGAEPDFSFNVGSTDAFFGFTPEGFDVSGEFLDDSFVCGQGGTNDTTLACWAGLTTVPRVIAERSSSNHPIGSTTTVNFRVGLGSSAGVVAGVYTATTTVTALPL
jgi:hypothetical protein